MIFRGLIVLCLLLGVLGGRARAADIRFEDVAASPASGIDFRHERAVFDPKLKKIMPWITAGGAAVAVADYDNQGLDSFYVTTSKEGALNKLFRNMGDFKFRDVAPEVGLADVNGSDAGTSSYALWFDYDNDGWRDLLLLRFGKLSLYRNIEGKRFEDVTEQAGLKDILVNATSAAAFDYDHSGHLSLLIAGYFPEIDMHHMKDSKVLFDSWETAKNGGRTFLLHNNGNGTFSDVTKQAGIYDTGWTMAIGIGDLSNDGWQDVYLARDFGTDKIFRNLGNGKFSDISEQAIGVDTKKGMNAELADYNNTGRLGIYVTNMTEPYLHECNMLWQNNGDFHFSDVSEETGTCDTGWGWGAKFLDADNAGLLDLYVVNGFLSAGPNDYMKTLLDFIFREDVDLRDANDWPDMTGYSMGGHEHHVLYHQEQGGVFKNIAASAGVDDSLDARGVAIADFDHSGRMDMIVSNVDGPVRLYRNVTKDIGRWIGFDLHDRAGHPEPVGARVYVTTGLDQQMREIAPSNGFEAQSSLLVHFGLGQNQKADDVAVVWPDGERQELGPLPCCKYFDIRRPEKKAELAPKPRKFSALALPVILASADAPAPQRVVATVAPPSAPTRVKVVFRDIATEAGVIARHHPPVFDPKLGHIMAMVSAGAAGGAIGDVQDRGLDDIFITDPRAGYPNHLFVNLGNGHFEDRAVAAGVANFNDADNVSTGGLFFDYDGDGLDDLLIFRFGSQVLLHNLGNGQFEDVSVKSGLAAVHGNILSAIALDADNDGYLDLYLGAYYPRVDLFHLKDDHVLHDSWENARNGGGNVFLHNNGDGTFSDQTAASGLTESGWTMALGYADIDNSGWQSIYVANDYGPDQIFHNEHGHFRNITASAIGFDTKKGMNAEFGDYDNGGLPGIFVTNVTEPFLHECNMLWHNNGDLTFTDIASEMGVCDGGWGWGGKFADVDNAGWLDLYQVNGFFTGAKSTDYLTVLLPSLWNNNGEDPSSASKWPPVNGMSMANKEVHRLWMNQGGLGFVRNDESALSNTTDGRAVFTSDLDNDGRIDFVVTNNDGPVQVFHNETVSDRNWIEFRLKGRPPNTDAAGAKVTIETADGRQYREVNIGNGFGGGSSRRVHFGLGGAPRVDSVAIRWPDGNLQQIGPMQVNQIADIREQDGTAKHASQ